MKGRMLFLNVVFTIVCFISANIPVLAEGVVKHSFKGTEFKYEDFPKVDVMFPEYIFQNYKNTNGYHQYFVWKDKEGISKIMLVGVSSPDKKIYFKDGKLIVEPQGSSLMLAYKNSSWSVSENFVEIEKYFGGVSGSLYFFYPETEFPSDPTPNEPTPTIPYFTLFTPAYLDGLWGYVKWLVFYVAPFLMIYIAIKASGLFVHTIKNSITRDKRSKKYKY